MKLKATKLMTQMCYSTFIKDKRKLYLFSLIQYKPSKSAVKNITTQDIGVLMPSSQRKLILKL